MACLDMYKNPDHKGHCPPMSPRLSFSNDFVDSHHAIKEEKSSKESPDISSDFEFSVTNHSMTTADELFFKGRLLPVKDNIQIQKPTLRDELLVDDDDHAMLTFMPLKGAPRWKGFLGLKRAHAHGTKTCDRVDGQCTAAAEGKTPKLVDEDADVAVSSWVAE